MADEMFAKSSGFISLQYLERARGRSLGLRWNTALMIGSLLEMDKTPSKVGLVFSQKVFSLEEIF